MTLDTPAASNGTQQEALDEAVRAGGGIMAFSRTLGVSPQAVNGGWRRRGYVPLSRAVEIERLWSVPAVRLVDDATRQALLGHDTNAVL